MQGSWVSSPNISGSGNMTPLSGFDSMGKKIPMQFGDYDTSGNYIGVPLRNYNRKGEELLSTRPIVIDPPVFTNFFEENKRKNDFDNNFITPKPIKLEPMLQFKPIEVDVFVPIKVEPMILIDTTPKYKPFKSFEPIIIEPMIDIFKTEKKAKRYNPMDSSTW